jgi:hypothetical protein
MAKAGDKFSRRRYWGATIGGKPLLFDADHSERASLEADVRRLQAEVRKLQQRLAAPPPEKRAYFKWQQEEILHRVRQKYPDGDIPRTADVHRAISDKKFYPSYNTVHDALGRKRPKK